MFEAISSATLSRHLASIATFLRENNIGDIACA